MALESGESMQKTDVLIIGGGLVGATFALMLARQKSVSVTLVETFAPPQEGEVPTFRPSFDGRSTALSRTTSKAFHRLGLWEQILQYSAPIREIHVSEAGRFGKTRLIAEEERVEAFGYVIENAWLGRVLMQAVAACPNIRFLAPARVTALERRANAVHVSVAQGEHSLSLACQLVVAADGAESVTRDWVGVGTQTFDYRQTAIVTNVRTSRPHGGEAYERFSPAGVLALLPRMEGSRALIWTVPTEAAAELLRMHESLFLQRLHECFGPRFGRFEHVAARHAYELKRVVADTQALPRLVILGNAAHFLHPVAGQGFNLCVRDCEALAAQILAARQNCGDMGDYAALLKYEQSRLRDQEMITQFSDKLVRVFSYDNFLLSHARSLGLLTFDLTPGAKDLLARMTMGVAG